MDIVGAAQILAFLSILQVRITGLTLVDVMGSAVKLTKGKGELWILFYCPFVFFLPLPFIHLL